MAARERAFRASVLSSTRSQPSVSKAWPKSNSLVSTFAPVRHEGLPTQVQPISSPRCSGRKARYRVLPIAVPLLRSRIAQETCVPSSVAAIASSIQR